MGQITAPTLHTLHALCTTANPFANAISHAHRNSQKSVELTEWLTRTSVKCRRRLAWAKSRSTSPNGNHVLVSTGNALFCNVVTEVSGIHEPNPALWLVTRLGKMTLSFPLGLRGVSPKKNFPKAESKAVCIYFIDQASWASWVLSAFKSNKSS